MSLNLWLLLKRSMVRSKVYGSAVTVDEVAIRELVYDAISDKIVMRDFNNNLFNILKVDDTLTTSRNTWSASKISNAISSGGGGGSSHDHSTDDRIPTETPNGSIKNFSTTREYVPGSLQVFVNGLLQLKDTDYTEDSDHKGYTFTSAPSTGWVIQHLYTYTS